jgi:hypothetical protein
MSLSRRSLVTGSLVLGVTLRLGIQPGLTQGRQPTITVYKSPS